MVDDAVTHPSVAPLTAVGGAVASAVVEDHALSCPTNIDMYGVAAADTNAASVSLNGRRHSDQSHGEIRSTPL